MEKTDSELIAAHLDGEREALEMLVNRYLKMVYGFAYRMTGSAADADDVTQESFFKAWKNIHKFDREKSFKTWLMSIVKNTAIDLLRKKRSIVFSELDTARDDGEQKTFEETIADTELLPEELLSRKEIAKEVQDALNKLPLNSKVVVLMHLAEDMTFEEIADALSEPMNTVKSRYRRALASLKGLLTGHHAPN
jgi:RNA polymerase sigma-70 factor (ECF subfamily)